MDDQTQPVGFIGLGIMGLPMAGHLLRAGHKLYVFSRTKAKADPLVTVSRHSIALTSASGFVAESLGGAGSISDNHIVEIEVVGDSSLDWTDSSTVALQVEVQIWVKD